MSHTYKAGIIQFIPELAKTPVKEWKKHWKTATDELERVRAERKKHGR